MFEYVDRRIEQEFREARLRAWLNTVGSWLGCWPRDMLHFPEVRRRVVLRGQRDLGIQTVPLDHIVGSEGRAHDFDRYFMPLRDVIASRWHRIGRAYYQHVTLPPVELYKLGGIYFVRDGNHRVSVARARGQVEIDAHVVEILTDVPLTPDLDLRVLERKEAQSEFLMWSDLLRLRPGAVVPVEASEPETYRELMDHVEGHRYFLGIDRGEEVSREEAIVSWYDNLYLPQVAAMRRHRVGDALPKRTETRLYLRIMEHRYHMSGRLGHDPGPDAAVVDFVSRFGSWRDRLRDRLYGVSCAQPGSPRRLATLGGIARSGRAIVGWLLDLLKAALRPLCRG